MGLVDFLKKDLQGIVTAIYFWIVDELNWIQEEKDFPMFSDP